MIYFVFNLFLVFGLMWIILWICEENLLTFSQCHAWARQNELWHDAVCWPVCSALVLFPFMWLSTHYKIPAIVGQWTRIRNQKISLTQTKIDYTPWHLSYHSETDLKNCWSLLLIWTDILMSNMFDTRCLWSTR